MAQFDVFRNSGSRRYPYVVDLQAELLRDLATHVVAPLTPRRRLGGKPITHLNPTVTIAGDEQVVLVQELAAYPTARLGEAVTSLRGRRDELIAALDLLFTGI